MPEVRLIDANALKSEMEIAPLYAVDMYTACAVIDAAPTIEPEVRHGRWIYNKYAYSCSKCNCSVPKNIFVIGCDFEYCPYCGARMDLRTPTEVALDIADSVMMGDAENDT